MAFSKMNATRSNKLFDFHYTLAPLGTYIKVVADFHILHLNGRDTLRNYIMGARTVDKYGDTTRLCRDIHIYKYTYNIWI